MFVNSIPFKVVAFKDMTLTHQKAIYQYMAIDGEAWAVEQSLDIALAMMPLGEKRDKAIKKAMKKAIEMAIEKYGHHEFGVGVVEINDENKKFVGSVDASEDFRTFEAYHEWYCSNATREQKSQYNEDWPVILSSPDFAESDGLFEDGWHRFHFRYIQNGVMKIPFIKYLPGREYYDPDEI